jgi:hypothetical protein
MIAGPSWDHRQGRERAAGVNDTSGGNSDLIACINRSKYRLDVLELQVCCQMRAV